MQKELKIESPVYGGNFISFDGKKTLFIPYVLPGETVMVETVSERKNIVFAEPVSVLHSSPLRISPECPNFRICGGCSYLHMDYNTELSFKKEIISDCVSRIGGYDLGIEIETINGPRFHYRSHAGIKSSGNVRGFYKRNSNTISPFPESGCLLLDERINEILNEIQETGDFKIAISNDGTVISQNTAAVIEKTGKFTFSRRISDFFQSNMFLRGRMLEIVCEMASGFDNRETLIDLGCGTGFFSIPLSNHYSYTLGVDIEKSNIKSAIKNKSLNSTGKLFFETCDMEKVEPPVKSFNTVVVDPPRPGLTPGVINKICSFLPENIIYVSCNPSTWARDSRKFIDADYFISKLIFIDMFPGTHHIELISLFSRGKSP